MTDPLGSALPQSASAATSATQRIDTDSGDRAQPRTDLNSDQTAVETGGSIPVVFCKRTGDVGGVWLDPPAAEGRIENNLANEVTIWWRLIVSDGEVSPILPTDVFQGDKRRGSIVFAYDARPDAWEPGDYLQQRWDSIGYHEVKEISSGPDQQLDISVRSRGNHVTYFRVDHTNVSPGAPLTQLPDYTATANVSLQGISFEPTFLETGDLAGKAGGNVTQYFAQEITETDRPPMTLPASFSYGGQGTGSFAGVSSLSFSETFTRQESEEGIHKRQVHVFVRNGIRVERLLDDYSVGPSDLFPDLALHFLQQRLAGALVDYELLEEAARFCERQDIRYNGVIGSPTNIRDWLNRVAPLSLLTVVQREGNIGLRPSVPYNADGEIYVGPTLPRCAFDESTIVDGSFSMTYVPVQERRPMIVEVLWRQQPDGNVGLIRASRVAYADVPEDAPSEQYDLSDFCTDHVHAVKVATAIQSRRRHVTHTAALTAIPGGYAGELIPGDVVEVSLARDCSDREGRLLAAQNVATPALNPVVGDHRFYYQVNSVATDRQGNVSLELTHWPVDEDGVSLVALDVANVDPGAVSTNAVGLPQPVEPTDPLFDESYVDNAFISLAFLPTQTIDGYWRICVQSSAPIPNGDLVLTLSNGYQLTIEEGETVGCVDVPITPDNVEDLLPDLDLDDLVIFPIEDWTDCVADLDGSLEFDQLSTADLYCVLNSVEGLDNVFDLDLDLGDLASLEGLFDCLGGYSLDAEFADLPASVQDCIEAALDDLGIVVPDLESLDLEGILDFVFDGFDLGDLGDLTLDDFQLVIDDLDLGDLTIDIGDLDLTDIADLDDLTIGLTDIDEIGIDLDNIALDPIGIDGVDAPDGVSVPGIDDPGIDGIDVGDVSIDVSGLGNLSLDFEDLEGLGEGQPCYGPLVTVYCHSIEFVGTTMVVKIRVAPTGVAPQASLGPLSATIAGGPAIARQGIGGPVVSPQPGNLPSVEFTAPVAYPSSNVQPGEIFQGEFQVQYPIDAFPPVADPQIVYQLNFAITSASGGYCNLAISPQILTAYFEPVSGNVPFMAFINYNEAKDDIFQIVFGGSILGTCNFSPDGQATAYLFIWTGDPTAIAAAKATMDSSYVWGTTTTVASGYPAPGTSRTMTMNNIGSNNNGNRGYFVYGRTQSGILQQLEWSPGDGEDYVAQTNW